MFRENTDKYERRFWDRIRARGRVTYIASVIVLQAWPIGLLFATFSLQPFEIHNPMDEIGQPLLYVFVWSMIGLVIGIHNWHHYRRSFGGIESESLEN